MDNTVENQNKILQKIQTAAEREGLHFFGLSDLDVSLDFKMFEDWLAENRHGGMEWMTHHMAIRQDPKLLLENAHTALIFGFPYFLGDRWRLADKDAPARVAQYARLSDYHKFMRRKLSNVIHEIKPLAPLGTAWRITVDSAPLLERALANDVGGSFIGKNTCVIHPSKGSFFLLGEVICTWLPESPPIKSKQRLEHAQRSKTGGCGTCKRCQVNCPTGALDEDYRIDARKCLSYWTIEWRGEIPVEYWPWIARYVFGCDICQLVCPYNRDLTTSQDAQLLARIDPDLDLVAIATMDQGYYEKVFGGTPMTRAKRGGLRRNALIAMVAQGDPRVKGLLDTLCKDPDPVIRGTVQTAIGYLENQNNHHQNQ